MAPPNRNRTRLARTERRDQIVDAAARVLRDREAAAVTFEEIAEAAGVSRALLYNYFGDRQGLIEAVEQRQLDDLERQVLSCLDGAVTQRELVAACVRAHLDLAGRNPAGYRLVAGRSMPAAVAADHAQRELGPVVGAQGLLVRIGTLAAVEAMVLAACEAGVDTDDATTDVITAFVTATLASPVADVGSAGT